MSRSLITVTASVCARVPCVCGDVLCEIKKRVKRAARVKVDSIIKAQAQLAGLAATIYCEKEKAL